jgi:hypothetical protein
MKMVKSLLLGSAAGLVAVAGAQAADLPVKAKPVQYVKICSLYGVGFYYIPGTDMCIKIGGWVRAEAAWNVNGSSTNVQNGFVGNNTTNNLWWRIRGYITADARNQTDYGTVRSYIAVGLSTNEIFDPAQTFNANRAFIQWAGFTAGRAQSFFDFYSQAALGYLGFTPNSDTGDGGWDVLAYTAQLGNGFSASISAETRRTTQIVGAGFTNGNPTTFTGGILVPGFALAANTGTINGGAAGVGFTQVSTGGIGYGGWNAPDVVGNLRVDQAWGSAQIGAAWHQVNATYYNITASTINPEQSGTPSDKSGWAAMAGLRLNAPMIGVGDYLAVQGIYTQGALRYIFQNPNGNWWLQDGGSAAFGILSDGVFGGSVAGGTATGINLTTAWGINAGYEHFWTPQWRTSLYGGWTSVGYNSQANNMLCALEGSGTGNGAFALAQAGCNNNWTSWWIGSRTQWNVTKDFYMGLDVAYLNVNSASTTSGFVFPTNAAGNVAVITPPATNTVKGIDDQNIWMARFRVHRDFYP